MRIHLISPTHYLPDGSLYKTTRYWTSGTTLPYLKALTPPAHEVSFTDELMHDLDVQRVEREADVVGITAMGPQIRRAYELADHFRSRGTRVVLGGTWVTLTPEESLAHADAVVAGEAEYVWARVLDDLAAGRSEGIYRATRWHDLPNIPTMAEAGYPDFVFETYTALMAPEKTPAEVVAHVEKASLAILGRQEMRFSTRKRGRSREISSPPRVSAQTSACRLCRAAGALQRCGHPVKRRLRLSPRRAIARPRYRRWSADARASRSCRATEHYF